MTRPAPIRALGDDDRGGILVLFAALLAIFMGIAALSFDFGRLAATQSEMQSFADTIALAAAGELDGRSDAITRARAAADTLVSDWQSYGDGDNTLDSGDITMAFYAVRPSDTGSVLPTTDARAAGYVSVRVTPRTVAPVFGAAFAALSGNDTGTDQVEAYAVAGFTSYACDITPMMFCAPSANFKAEDYVGAAFQLRLSGGSSWGPGAFGFIDPSATMIDQTGVCAGETGSKLDMCLISAVGNRTSCFATSGVDIATGQRVGNYEAALNVRFDIYNSASNSLRNNSLYPPAPNVLSGYGPESGQCIGQNPIPLPTVTGLPPDDCQTLGTCGYWGDADWSVGRASYVTTNYGGVDPHPGATTRYDYYLAEIDRWNSATGNLKRDLTEMMRPQCSSRPAGDPDRRVFVAAAIDCVGNPVGGGERNVPVLEFVEVFMLAPVGVDGTRDVWVEVIGGLGGVGGNQTDGIVRDVVQLYD